MQKMTDIQISSQGQMNKPKAQPAISDKAVDMVDMIHKTIEGVYNVMPLDEAGKMAWVSALGGCKQRGLELANIKWIKTESKPPRPADLLRTYRELREAQSNSIEGEKTRKAMLGIYKCAYCKDTGLMFIKQKGYTNTATNCLCQRVAPERDLAEIKSRGWEFDYKQFAWVQTSQDHIWMGDVV